MPSPSPVILDDALAHAVTPSAFRHASRALRKALRKRLYAAGVTLFAPHVDLQIKVRGGRIVNVYVGLVDPGFDADEQAERAGDAEFDALAE